MNGKFKTLAMAMAAVRGPFDGLTAFIAFATAHIGMHKFVLVELDYYNNDRRRFWYKDCTADRMPYEDEHGLHYTPKPDWKVIKAVWADSFDQLDWKESSYYVQDGESGWLSPDGTFYGCHYGGHSNLARRIVGMGYGEIEAAGYVHVDEAGAKDKYSWRMRDESMQPTEAQKQWLIQHGHDLDPYGHKARKQAETISLGENGEYKIDKAADKAAFERMMARAGIKAPKRNLYGGDY